MDEYSKPLKKDETNLRTRFDLNPRRAVGKSGRELLVAYDERFPMIEGFENKYSYYVRFLEANNTAGNHYHEIKQEIMIPIVGKFDFRLEDIQNGDSESFTIDAKDNKAIYVKPRVSHSVKSLEKDGVLLVVASSPNSDGDEYKHIIK